MCDVQQPAGWSDLEPEYKREMCEFDYDYEVDVSKEDLEDYFGNEISDELMDFIDIDELEEDEDFIEFMEEKYEEEATESAETENS